jgi:hypothetical protein
MDLLLFFPCKKAYYVKRQDLFNIFFICFLWSSGLDMELEPEPEPQP